MDRFARWVIRHRLGVIAAVVLLTIAGAISIAKWARIESDISKFLPKEDPVVIRFTDAGELFGGVAVAMVGVELDDAFSREALELVHRLTQRIKEVPGVTWVISLTEMDDVQERIVDGERAVAVSKVVDPDQMPTTPEQLAALKRYVLGKEQLVGQVVSEDARLANLTFKIAKEADRVEVASAVAAVVRPLVGEHTVYFAGLPFWMKAMSELILRDMLKLVPIVILVVIFILYLSFRTLRGVVLPLMTVLISSTWAMGLMAALKIPITTLSNVIPVLLIALGTAYAIHLLHKVDELKVGDGSEHRRNLRRAMVDVMVPIGLAGLTTVIGFLSFLTSNLVFIRHFGLMAAFGIFCAMVVALTLLPAVMSFLQPAKPRTVRPAGRPTWLSRLLDRAAPGVMRHRRAVPIAAVVLAAAAAAFIPSIERQFNMISYFPEDSQVRRADRMMRKKLGGNVPVWVTVDGNPKDPFVLQQMHTVEKYLRTLADVSKVKSIASLVAEMNRVMSDRQAVPGTADEIGNLWFHFQGKDVLRQFVDKSERHALIQGVSKSSSTKRLREIVAEVERFLAQLPRVARRVDLAAVDESTARRARQARLDQVAQNLALDLAYRLQDGEYTRGQILGWLREGLSRPTPRVGAKAYETKLRAFLLSDESDIELEDTAVAISLAEVLSRVAEIGKPDRRSIEAHLRQHLPAEAVAEDPAGVGYLAKSLELILAEARQRHRIAHLLDHLVSQLPVRARADERLRRDLAGDLWPLGATVVWLPVDRNENAPEAQLSRMDLHQTGMHHISVNVDDRLVFSQLSSLGLAAVMAMLLLMIQFRSMLAGLLGMIPMAATLLITFGAMGAFKIDLEPSTVLIASLVVGVGIDYTIHFLSRARLEMIRNGELAGALQVVQRTAGRAILINAVTVIAGQLVFLAGELIPLHFFGALLALAMVTSALAAVTVMPAVLLLTRPAFLSRKAATRNRTVEPEAPAEPL